MRRVISVWLPFFPTDRLRRLGESAPRRDVSFVTVRRDGQGQVVVACDRRARRLGVRPGMGLAEAEIIAPDLVTDAADPTAEKTTLGRLAIWCFRYGPLVALDPPDGLWIESFGCAHLFGGEAAMLADIFAHFTAAGFAVRVALADTPGAAHALARYGRAEKIIVPIGGAAEALAPLPPRALRLADETTTRLTRLGIMRIGTLSRMPRGPLTRRFGEAVLRRLDQALGGIPEPIPSLAPPPTLAERLSFLEPLVTAEALSRAIAKLTERLCRKLERCEIGARHLDLRFVRIDGVSKTVRVTTAQPRRDARLLARLLVEHLEEIDPEPGIAEMQLDLPLFAPLDPVQETAQFTEDDGVFDLSALIDRLTNRLGVGRVYRVSPLESDVPERSVVRVSPLAPGSGKSWPEALPRPTRLLSPPEPVQAIALLPDHPPVQFVWRGRRYRLSSGDGPERVFGEWWRNDAEVFAVRDYFRVEDTDGYRYWLFRHGDGTDPITGNGSWFLHGFF